MSTFGKCSKFWWYFWSKIWMFWTFFWRLELCDHPLSWTFVQEMIQSFMEGKSCFCTCIKVGDSARGIRIIFLPALKPTGLNPSTIPDHHSMVKYIPDIYVRKVLWAEILSMMGGCVPDMHVWPPVRMDWRKLTKTRDSILRMKQTIVYCWYQCR